MADLNSTLIRGNLRVIEDVNISGVLSAASIKEGGTALSSKYLGISAKAADSDLLDGHDSSYFINTSNIGSQSVNYANSAGSASSATTASSADYATSAGSASTATTATSASSADAISNLNLIRNSGGLSSGGWDALGGRYNGSVLAISYANSTPANWYSSAYSASLVFGCQDTKGLFDCAYSSPVVTFGGAYTGGSSADNPTWYMKLTGTTATTYNLDNMITTSNIGSQSVNYANSAGSASSATTASSALEVSHLKPAFSKIFFACATVLFLTSGNEFVCKLLYVSVGVVVMFELFEGISKYGNTSDKTCATTGAAICPP